jgi:hypothetical protein
MDMGCVACSVFRREIEALRSKGVLQLDACYVDVRLHHDRSRMMDELERLVHRSVEAGRKTVLVVGNCDARMHRLEQETLVSRTAGETCVDILLGEESKELRANGMLPILPDWLVSWRDALIAEDGLATHLPGAWGKGPLRSMVYLHTGLIPVPFEQLNELSLFTNIPYEVKETPLHCLYARITEAAERLRVLI